MALTRSEFASKVYQSHQDDAQREKLILDHLEYAHQVIYTMVPHLPPSADIDNLVAAGLLGLTEAANNFDRSRGVNFKSFAYLRIRGAVVDEMRRNSPLPQKMLQQIGEIREVIDRLEPPVTPEHICEETTMTLEQVEDCMAAMRVCAPQSWDEIGGFASVSLATNDQNPAAKVERNEQVNQLADCIELLDERERAIIVMYHLDQMLLKEIGQVLGISESRTSRLLARAEFNLRQLAENKIKTS